MTISYIDAFTILEQFEDLLTVVVELDAKLVLNSEQCKDLLEALNNIDY